MKVFFLLAVSVFLSLAAYGGEIQGKVSNAQGAAVAGATVTVSSDHNSSQSKATTSADGSYRIADLPAGEYTVTVSSATGAALLRRRILVRESSEAIRADFQFPQVAESVTAAEERNPNIFIYRIDLNDLRNRLNVGRGPDPTYVPEFLAEQNYFGVEFGAPLFQFNLLRPRTLASAWRGSVYYLHQNSVLNARNFFNVGPLLPSRVNSYDLTAGGPLFSRKLSLLLDFGQTITTGMVNGNIQAPSSTQLIPRSPDPQLNAVISNILRAYPAQLPNLILPNGQMQLNSNAPRNIHATDSLGRLDFKPKDDTSYAFRYSINNYNEEPFQLVAGQNPQTFLRSQGAYTSWTRTFSPATVARIGFHYDRATADLEPTKRFSDLFAPLGITTVPDIKFNSQSFADIGPGLQFPRRRVQNRFQPYVDFSHTMGRHTLKAGGSSARVQVNDLQSDTSRGLVTFSTDFGRSEVENLLLGTPSNFTKTLGNLYRGFRNWEHSAFVEDQFRVRPGLSLSLGLRYEMFTTPTEVNHLTNVGPPTDKNNFAPRFGFAWNPRRGKTTVRASYGISYGMLFPVSYGMTRFNPPANQVISIDAPDLASVLRGTNQQPTPGGRSSLFQLSPDLVMPYSNQYTFGIERALPWASTLRAAYIGMRSIHQLSLGVYNRARPVAGIPATTATVNLRRPDPRYYAISIIESNTIAYYDAAQVTWDKRLSHGLVLRASYTFSKNIDTGGDFTNTASGVDKPPESGEFTSEFVSRVADMKGVSLFDTPHVFSLSYSYTLPAPGWLSSGHASTLFKGWQISGTTIFQSGTPFHFHTGSDGPGYGNVDGESHDRPNVTDPSILGKSLDSINHSWEAVAIDPANKITCVKGVFLQCKGLDTNIAPSGRGNMGMNTFRKDGTANWNLAIGRTFRLPGGREKSLQFRSEFINLFNTAQFEKPGVQLASPIFGQITNTNNKGRQIQFSLRLNF